MKVTNSPVHSELPIVQLSFERASEAIFWFDAEGKCQRVNETACEWLGFSKEEFQNLTTSELCAPQKGRTWADHWNEIKDEKFGTIDTHLRRKDGHSIPAELACHYFEVEGEEFVCAFARNQTDRYSANQAFEKLKRHHELILNAAPDGIFGLDLEGHHTFVNPAAARMLGYQVEELLGQASHETWHHTKTDGSPYPREACNIYSAYKDGTVHCSDKEVFWRKNGTSFPVEYESTPIRDEEGALVGAVVIFRDISYRLQCEEAVEKERQHVEKERQHSTNILNAAGEGIFGLDIDGIHTFVNPAAAKMLGYEEKELYGKPSHVTWHHTKLDGTPYPPEECPIYKAYKDGMVHEGNDEVFWRKDGTSFPAQYTSTPIKDANGRLAGAVVTFLDITEKKRLTAEAEITKLLGNIGHDIKNMLVPLIMGSGNLRGEIIEHFSRLPSSTAETEKDSKERAMVYLDMIVNNSRRIQDQVREMADAVKGVTTPPQFASCEAEKIIDEVFETLRVYAGEKGITLDRQGLDSLPILEADERRLFNAFYNLINNAIPEVSSGGSVTVSGMVGQDGKTVKLSIADTGRGMPPEIRDSLFTQQGISKKKGGTGLGLKIVKDVVDAHKGQITVESEEGVGTTFHLILPITRTP